MVDSSHLRSAPLCINPADEASNCLSYAIDRETCGLAMYQATRTYSLLLSLSLYLFPLLILLEILPPMETRRKHDGGRA